MWPRVAGEWSSGRRQATARGTEPGLALGVTHVISFDLYPARGRWGPLSQMRNHGSQEVERFAQLEATDSFGTGI